MVSRRSTLKMAELQRFFDKDKDASSSSSRPSSRHGTTATADIQRSSDASEETVAAVRSANSRQGSPAIADLQRFFGGGDSNISRPGSRRGTPAMSFSSVASEDRPVTINSGPGSPFTSGVELGIFTDEILTESPTVDTPIHDTHMRPYEPAQSATQGLGSPKEATDKGDLMLDTAAEFGIEPSVSATAATIRTDSRRETPSTAILHLYSIDVASSRRPGSGHEASPSSAVQGSAGNETQEANLVSDMVSESNLEAWRRSSEARSNETISGRETASEDMGKLGSRSGTPVTSKVERTPVEDPPKSRIRSRLGTPAMSPIARRSNEESSAGSRPSSRRGTPISPRGAFSNIEVQGSATMGSKRGTPILPNIGRLHNAEPSPKKTNSRVGSPALSSIDHLFEAGSPPGKRPGSGQGTTISIEDREYEFVEMRGKAATLTGTPIFSNIETFEPTAVQVDDESDNEPGGSPLDSGNNEDLELTAPEAEATPEEGISGLDGAQAPVADETAVEAGQRSTCIQRLPNLSRVLAWIMGRNLPQEGRASPEVSKSEPSPQPEWEEDEEFMDIGEVMDICLACTTPYIRALDSVHFKSSLRLSYNDDLSQMWSIGDKLVLTETAEVVHPEERELPLVMATRLIKSRTDVPVPNIFKSWKEKGKFIVISERAQGQRLYDVWWDLSESKREKIAKQVANYVELWRQHLPAERIASLSGGAVWNHDNLFGTSHEGFGPFKSDAAFWRAIRTKLKDKGIMIAGDTKQVLKDCMPESRSCVFTHGDLSCNNIYVHNGNVSAITGFDNAANLPVWAENVALHFCSGKEDEKWKALLSKHMTSYRAALDWWSLWTAVEDVQSTESAESTGTRLEMLKERCRRWKKTQPNLERPSYGPGESDAGIEYDQGQESIMGGVLESEEIRQEFREALKGYLTREERGFISSSEEGEGSKKGGISSARAISKRKSRQLHSMVDDAAYTQEGRGEPQRWRGREGVLLENEEGMGEYEFEPVFYSDDSMQKPRQVWRNGQQPKSSSEGHRQQQRVSVSTKGLRPLSLPLLSENAKDNLRGLQDLSDGGSSDNRAEVIAKTLRSLSSIQEDDNGGSDVRASHGKAVGERRRNVIFRNKNAPGGLYAALQAKGPRRHGRSHSENPMVDEGTKLASDDQRSQPKSRPQSMILPTGNTRLMDQLQETEKTLHDNGANDVVVAPDGPHPS